MNYETPLDAPITNARNKGLQRAHKIFFGIELSLFGLMLFGGLLKFASLPFSSELLIITVSILMILFMLVPFLIFGSRGWPQHIGSYAVGMAVAFALSAFLFRIEHWFSATEMGIIAFPPALVLFIVVAVVLIIKPARWSASHFYKHVLVLLVLSLLTSAGTFFGVFFH